MGHAARHTWALPWRTDAKPRPAPGRETASWFKVIASLVAAGAVAPILLAVGGMAGTFVAPLVPFFVVAMIPSFRRAVHERSGTHAERRLRSERDERAA